MLPTAGATDPATTRAEPTATILGIGDEKAEHTLRQIGAHQPLDIIGIAPARFPAPDIDDRAKAALERTAAPSIDKAPDRLAITAHDIDRQKGCDLLLQSRQVLHVVVDRL